MKGDDLQSLRKADLMFFGSIVAGQSHEITNVLNIINELAGLEDDLLREAGRGRPLDMDRLILVVEKIRNQVGRGQALIRSVNRFAHSVDQPVTVFDLKDALEEVADLAQRPARLGKIALEKDFPGVTGLLEASPFLLKEAVFTCVKVAFAASSEERRVTVRYRIFDRAVEIEVHSADPIGAGPEVKDLLAGLGLLLREMGGRLAAAPGDGQDHRIVLSLPLAGSTVGPTVPGDGSIAGRGGSHGV